MNEKNSLAHAAARALIAERCQRARQSISTNKIEHSGRRALYAKGPRYPRHRLRRPLTVIGQCVREHQRMQLSMRQVKGAAERVA